MSQNNELLACYKVLSLLEAASDNTEVMLDNMPGVIVVLSPQYRVLRANLEFAHICGCSIDDILGFDFLSLFSRENSDTLQRNVTLLKARGSLTEHSDFELEISAPSAQGAIRQFYWQASLVQRTRKNEGDLISITGKDLSELYQSEMKLKNIFSNIPLGMLMLDANGVVSEVLSQYSEVLFERNDLAGKRFTALFKDARNLSDAAIVEGLKQLDGCFGQSKVHYDKVEKAFPKMVAVNVGDSASSRWLNFNYQPIIKFNRVEGFIIMVENATDSMQAQRELERVSALERQIQAVYESAIRDPLTGLFTRLFMKDSLTSLIGNFSRGSIEELCVLLMDVDHFKSVNDTYGHQVGDSILSEVGRIILKQIRETDVAIRYGGEEFLIILPSNTSEMTSGRVVGNRIREEFAKFQLELPSGQVVKATISGGAAWCRKGENINLTIERADAQLYHAKRGGRNCIKTESGR